MVMAAPRGARRDMQPNAVSVDLVSLLERRLMLSNMMLLQGLAGGEGWSSGGEQPSAPKLWPLSVHEDVHDGVLWFEEPTTVYCRLNNYSITQ